MAGSEGNKASFILGVDGGGTKTIAKLQHLASGKTTELLAGASSLTNDFDGALITLTKLINDLLSSQQAKAHQVSVVMGLAGGCNQSQVDALVAHLKLPFAHLSIVNDSQTSLIGANNGQAVAMVALGTGSVAGRLDADGNEQYFGGWGFPVGDEGSGAQLGFAAIKQLILELDTKANNLSSLATTLYLQHQNNKDKLLNWLKVARPGDFAQLTPLVFELQNQCSAAKAVLNRHIIEVDKLISMARGDSNLPVVLMGGLAKQCFAFLPVTTQEFCQLQLGSSLEGACIMAAKQISQTIELDTVKPATAINQTSKAVSLEQLNTLTSEQNNQLSSNLDELSSSEIVELMNQQDSQVANAITSQLPSIANAVDVISQQFNKQGRLIYIGAGTSGRLGVLDAVECPPTFSVDSHQVTAIIAGGQSAMFKAVEGAEDSDSLARNELQALNLHNNDVVVGIAASGRTPYVIGGLEFAKSIGVPTISISCNTSAPIASLADINICVNVGPEVLTGSTRLKSGTAQKMVLNMLSTASMIRVGKSYGNLMVDVTASNNKLKTRAINIVMQVCQCEQTTALAALEECGFQAKLAILMVKSQQPLTACQQALSKHNGFLRAALADMLN